MSRCKDRKKKRRHSATVFQMLPERIKKKRIQNKNYM